MGEEGTSGHCFRKDASAEGMHEFGDARSVESDLDLIENLLHQADVEHNNEMNWSSETRCG